MGPYQPDLKKQLDEREARAVFGNILLQTFNKSMHHLFDSVLINFLRINNLFKEKQCLNRCQGFKLVNSNFLNKQHLMLLRAN